MTRDGRCQDDDQSRSTNSDSREMLTLREEAEEEEGEEEEEDDDDDDDVQSLFTVDMPGVMSRAEVIAQFDLDKIQVDIYGMSLQTRVSDLQTDNADLLTCH